MPLIALFTSSSFAGAALATNLIPALMERGLSPTTAAAFGGLFGIMQLPGRFAFAKNTGAVTPMALLGASVGLQVAGLLTLAATHGPVGIGAGVALFAGGSGLATVARPYLVLVFYGQDRAGEMNGRFRAAPTTGARGWSRDRGGAGRRDGLRRGLRDSRGLDAGGTSWRVDPKVKSGGDPIWIASRFVT